VTNLDPGLRWRAGDFVLDTFSQQGLRFAILGDMGCFKPEQVV